MRDTSIRQVVRLYLDLFRHTKEKNRFFFFLNVNVIGNIETEQHIFKFRNTFYKIYRYYYDVAEKIAASADLMKIIN